MKRSTLITVSGALVALATAALCIPQNKPADGLPGLPQRGDADERPGAELLCSPDEGRQGRAMHRRGQERRQPPGQVPAGNPTAEDAPRRRAETGRYRPHPPVDRRRSEGEAAT